MHKHKDKLLGLLISAIFIALILWNLDTKMLVNTFKMFNYGVLWTCVPLYILGLIIRGVRWKYILCTDKKLSAKEAFFAFTAGNTFNSYLPARAGDFWRAYHVGNKINESKMKLLGSILLERLIDGISVVLILFFAVKSYFYQPWILKVAYISISLFLGSLIIVFILLKTNKIEWFFTKLSNLPVLKIFKNTFDKISVHLQSFVSGFEVLNDAKCSSMAFSMSIFAWLLECVVTYFLITGFGYDFGISVSFFVISFIALSTIIPSSSVFVGPYQFAYILALSIYHVNKSQALAIAFIHQFMIMLVITIISIIYFTLTNTSIKELQTEMDKTQEKEI